MKHRWVRTLIGVLVSIAVPQSAGGVGAIFTSSGLKEWYPHLRKPSFTPPSSIFGPVWITLYTLMGLAAYLVWRKREAPDRDRALVRYAVQLVLNALWSAVFFGLKSPGGGLAVIAALWLAIVATLASFAAISTGAALLLVPYLLWVTFAALLNLSIKRLND